MKALLSMLVVAACHPQPREPGVSSAPVLVAYHGIPGIGIADDAMGLFPCGMFQHATDEAADVNVYQQDGITPTCGFGPPFVAGKALAITYRCARGDVEIWGDFERDEVSARLIYAHELGHGVGLQHDEALALWWPGEVSIMDPFVAKHADRPRYRLSLPVLMDDDREFLEGRYCQ